MTTRLLETNSFGKAIFNDYSLNHQWIDSTTAGEPYRTQIGTPMFMNMEACNANDAILERFMDSAKKQVKEKKKMKQGRGLYQVILVDPKEGKIILNKLVISSKPEDVLLEAGAGEVIKGAEFSVSDIDKIINFMGPIRKTKKNKDVIVELISDEDKE